MRNWRIASLGVLDALTTEEAAKVLEFVGSHKTDILKVLVFSWGCMLAMVFTLIVTVRLALL